MNKQTKIGMVPEDWEVKKIKDIGEVTTGKTPPTEIKEYFGLDFPFIRIPDMGKSIYIDTSEMMLSKKGAEYLKNLRLPKDSVMVSCLATVGKAGITVKDSFTNQQINSLICNKNKVIPLWVYYFFKNNISYLESLGGGGSVYTNISKSKFENSLIYTPKIEEQEKIVKILSSLDEKIELNQNMNKTIEAIAQVIFKCWFIDFEFPNENGEPYKSSGGEMVDSELGLIPKRWNVRSLNQIANFLNGLAMQKYRPLNDENYLSVLKIKELKVGKTSKNSDKCSMNIDPKYIVDDGDVVFSWSGSLEVKLWCDGKVGLNQHLFKVTSANYPKWFYYYWIKHHIEDFRRIAEGKTTTMGHIKREHLSKAKVFDPGKKFFEKFDKVVNGLIELYINNEKEIKYLSQLRDILLPKLMSGEIRVLINSKF